MEFQEYPRHMHRPGGVHAVVHSDAERDAYEAQGWYLTPLEAEQASVAASENPRHVHAVVPHEVAPLPAPEDAETPAVPARRRKAKA